MPEMDGLAATRAIRELEESRAIRTPIVAMTAMVMAGDEEACLMAGMNALISKPVLMRTLKEAIEHVLDASGAAQTLPADTAGCGLIPASEASKLPEP